MNEKNERMIDIIGEIDEKYIKESEEKMSTRKIITIAASIAIIIALSLVLFLPYAPVKSNISAYSGSEYYPLIEGIEDYRLGFMQPRYKNNFETLTAAVGDLFGSFTKGVMAPGADDMAGSAPEVGNSALGNGSYVESTDNQVSGVIESDLFKMTDKYIFRIGYYQREALPNNARYNGWSLRVYSIEKEESKLVSEYKITPFEDQGYTDEAEIYLSLDCRTVNILINYNGSNGGSKVGVVSLDVSDVSNISERGRASIDGYLNTSRLVDGRLLLITDFYFNRNAVDYNDPATFVPTIDRGEGKKAIEFEDIIYPDKVESTRYSVVALLDAEDLELLGANALLNFASEVYVSENNVYVTREYTKKTADGENSNEYTVSNTTDIAVLNYAGEWLEKKGVITVRGYAEDQYSFDEKDGYLRVVTSTLEQEQAYEIEGAIVSASFKRNAGLYIFNLADNSLAYKVEDFAPDGEEATAVRFDGDKCYVCTAVVVSFTDPVYFFDLSDYENITYTDTGIIEGYSDHLINYGNGFLLGIGRENWEYNKVEIYEEQGSSVVSVDEFKFGGSYSTDYKAYLVNREANIFGFGVNYYLDVDDRASEYSQRYILLQFNGYKFSVLASIEIEDMRAETVRAAYIDGYLYITTNNGLTVEKII